MKEPQAEIADPVLIGPVGVGKSTVARCLSEKIGLPVVSMDTVRDNYYRELGYDADFADSLFKQDGPASVWCYLKAFDPHSVERLLQDYPGHIIDMGGGSSVHEHEDQFNRVSSVLSRYQNVILLLPFPDREESLRFLNSRTGWGSEGRNINRILLSHPSNGKLATITVYTANRSPDEIAEEIARRIALSSNGAADR